MDHLKGSVKGVEAAWDIQQTGHYFKGLTVFASVEADRLSSYIRQNGPAVSLRSSNSLHPKSVKNKAMQ